MAKIEKDVGMVVIAYEGVSKKVLYKQEFLYCDLTEEKAKEKARLNHKHIRDIFPESTVELNFLYETITK